MEADVCLETDLGNWIKLHAKPRVGRAVNNADMSCKILKSCRKWYLWVQGEGGGQSERTG